MRNITNLFPVTGVQNSDKICHSYWQKFAATFLCPTVYIWVLPIAYHRQFTV